MPAELTPVEKAEIGIVRVFAAIYPRLVKATDFQLARKEFISAMVQSAQGGFPPAGRRSLKDFREWLCANICVGHKYRVVEETPTSLSFRFTGCPWATCFREAGESEIGKFFCDVDETMAKAFNPRFAFERTQVLMDGDSYCNHHYWLA